MRYTRDTRDTRCIRCIRRIRHARYIRYTSRARDTLRQAELVLRTAQFHHIRAGGLPGSSSSTAGSTVSAVDAASSVRLPAIASAAANDGSLTARSDPGMAGGAKPAGDSDELGSPPRLAADGTPLKASLKQQYVRWLGGLLDEIDDDEEEEATPEVALHKVPPRNRRATVA